MADALTMRIATGDEVRVYYGAPGQATSFIEGVVSRLNVTTTRGRGFLIDITRDVLLGREQPVKPGYQHYVLYEQMENFPGKVEVLSQVQDEPAIDLEHGSVPQVQEEPEAEPEAAPVSEQMPVVGAEQVAEEETVPDTGRQADGSQTPAEREGNQAPSSRIIPFFGRRK